METLDAEAVRRWFDAVPAASRGLPQYLSGPLSSAEREVLRVGRRAVLAALDLTDGPHEPGARDETECGDNAFGTDLASGKQTSVRDDAALWLADYLTAFAAGLAGARRAEGAEVGAASPLHVVAGLITGAAAVAGRPTTGGGVAMGRNRGGGEDLEAAGLPDPSLDPGRDASAGQAAYQVGAAAADEAVNGAPLDRVTQAAHRAASGSWPRTRPSEPVALSNLQRRRLLVRLIAALAAVTGRAIPAAALPSDAPGWQLECVDTPAEHVGKPLLAEITFLTADDAGAADLADVLRAMEVSFGTYSDERSLGFHIHASDPGRVISEIFALVMPFDLRISRLPWR